MDLNFTKAVDFVYASQEKVAGFPQLHPLAEMQKHWQAIGGETLPPAIQGVGLLAALKVGDQKAKRLIDDAGHNQQALLDAAKGPFVPPIPQASHRQAHKQTLSVSPDSGKPHLPNAPESAKPVNITGAAAAKTHLREVLNPDDAVIEALVKTAPDIEKYK